MGIPCDAVLDEWMPDAISVDLVRLLSLPDAVEWEVPDDRDRGVVQGRGRHFRAPMQQVPGPIGREWVRGGVGIKGVARAAGSSHLP